MRRDSILKLFSLAVAVALYLFVTSGSNSRVVDLLVPVELSGVPEGFIRISPREPQVRVVVKGPSSLVSKMVNLPPILTVKFPPGQKYRFVVPMQASMLALPPYAQVQRFDPPELELVFDAVKKKEIPVRVPTIGAHHDGWSLKDIQVTPQQVIVEGPAVEVDALREIETYPVDLREVHSDIDRELSVRVPGIFTKVQPALVQIHVVGEQLQYDK